MFQHNTLRYITLVLFAVGCLVQAFTAGYFGLEILTEILILAMVVIALDIVAGFGGMVSLCHGALMGVGAYSFAILSTKFEISPGIAMVAAIAITGVISWGIGAISSRTHGIYFIMATLAFGQMGYSLVFEAPIFGGDDGLGGISRIDMTFAGLNINDSQGFVFFCMISLAVVYGASVLILRSGLGRSLTGVMHNEQRMRALGLKVWRVKADVFGLSGMIAGLAGTLAAQHIMYISPGLLSWTLSGEALVVVILGGLGTLVGPMVGAAAFVLLKHELSNFTNHWHLFVGIILIVVVMSRANGIFGWLEARWNKVFDRSDATEGREPGQLEAASDD